MIIKNRLIVPSIITAGISGFIVTFFMYIRSIRGTYLFNRISRKMFTSMIKNDSDTITEIANQLISAGYINKVAIRTGNKRIIRTRPVYTRKIRNYKRSFYYNHKRIGTIWIQYS